MGRRALGADGTAVRAAQRRRARRRWLDHPGRRPLRREAERPGGARRPEYGGGAGRHRQIAAAFARRLPRLLGSGRRTGCAPGVTLPPALADLYRDRTAAARAWRAAGGRVVGYFADDVPTALIEAAGFLPYRIWGDPEGGQPAAMARGPIDVRADRLEFVNSWVHLIDRGRFDFVDHFIVSNSRKYVLQLAERLRALAKPPSFHILDRALGQSDLARDYNRRQVPKLVAALEGWAGEPISADALSVAIRRYNDRATELRRIAGLRAEARISGTEALRAISAARWMHSSHYLPLIRAVNQQPTIAGRKLFVTGSGQDQDAAYAAAETAGAVIVGESHNWSARLLEAGIPDGDPFDAIGGHYADQADFITPLRDSVDATVSRCRNSGAEAVLTLIYAYDDAPLWEAPSERAAIGLPTITLAELPYRIAADSVREALA
ncbi:MAG: 2-hydroxyacyl-CoA dehydratase [Sphingomonadales bacterium]|nr:MAG: 2-hydroxyacyl-CoA dehydratase [Sphingomonadales bacterium]